MRVLRTVMVVVLVGLLLGTAASGVAADSVEWTEPQALNIVDIAGQVPDSVLAGHIVSYSGGGGVVLYESAQVISDTLQITVQASPRYVDWWGGAYVFNTLGQMPNYDHIASTMPAATVRLYLNSQDITDNVMQVEYLDPGPTTPTTNAADWYRYPEAKHTVSGASLLSSEGLNLPANMGGSIYVLYQPADTSAEVWITAVYTLPVPDVVTVEYLGHQTQTFQSFLGDYSPGDAGSIEPLVQQLRAIYEDRHPRIYINAPSGTNYVLFNYPTAEFDIYASSDENRYRSIGGTVRLAPDNAMLSQNLQHGGAFPLNLVYQDADQSAGPYLSLLPQVDRFTPPEYFVLPGVEFDSCFYTGDCSLAKLEEIYDATAEISVVYLKATPNSSQVQAVSLRAADTNYVVGVSEVKLTSKAEVVVNAPAAYRVFIPLILRQVPLAADVDHPAGLFELDSGRMVGYVP